MIIDIDEFLELSSSNPILDVRSPAEFEYGHIPGARNFPLFDNDERKEIGITYKQTGREKAVLKGLDLVKDRMTQMVEDAGRLNYESTVLVHCWRGGLRSESVSWLLKVAGLPVNTLDGGYKSYRNKVLSYFNQPLKIAILSGSTGSGKTEILNALETRGEQVVDLEALASHKGSVFGGIGQGKQPSSEHFQNLVFEKFRNLDPEKIIWIEDESPVIGNAAIPETLWRQMLKARRVKIEIDKEARIERLVSEYGEQDLQKIVEAIPKLEKRLGNKNMNDAIEAVKKNDLKCAASILLTYYDKAYDNSFSRKKLTQWFEVSRGSFDLDSIISEIIEKAANKSKK